MSQEKDLYAELGLERDVGTDELRQAYRRLARQFHPDVNPNDPKAEERFKEISAAYNVLSDPEKRKIYDEFGLQGLQDGFDPAQAREYQRWAKGAHQSPFQQEFRSDLDLEDLLSGYFARKRGEPGPRPGSDAVAHVEIGFLEAVRGDEVTFAIEGRPSLQVKIPPGADDGTRIRLAGQGEAGASGGPPGDLYLVLRVRPHEFFTRDGDDLTVDVPVTIPELVLGASIDVPTPDGSVKMTVPPGTDNGKRLRLRGKGALHKGRRGRGDLYVRLVAKLPESEDPRLAELAKELESLYGDADPRRHLRSRP